LNRLIEDKLLLRMADERGIKVTPEDIDDQFVYLLYKFGIGVDEKEARLKQMFGWGEREYKRNIVYPELVRSKMAVALLFENRDISEAYAAVKQARNEIAMGGFAEVARTHSDDEPSKFIGGELGLFSREELPFWFRDTAFDLVSDEVSDVVISPEGYNLLQVVLQDGSKERGRVLLRRILLREDFLSEALEERKERAKILTAI
jgi:hypothetical protein